MSNQDRVFTKCAWRLIPFMGLLYVVSFVDRTNAGLAALTMNKDLGFSPTVFGFGAGIFFVGYSLFQVPANVLLERIGARRWIFCITAVWGLLAAANALVQTPASFYVVRFLLDLRLLALGIGAVGTYAAIFSIYLWLPQVVQAMGFSNTATGFIVALCYLVGTPAMILGGRSSSRRRELIWHVALPSLLVAASFVVASFTQSNTITLAALALALTANFAVFGPYYSLPSSFLRGTAVAGGIGVIGTFGNIGAFLGPVLTGVLLQGSGNYRTGFAVDALLLALGALIVIAVGRALALRSPAMPSPQPAAAGST